MAVESSALAMGSTNATPSRRCRASLAPPQHAAMPYGHVPVIPMTTLVPVAAARTEARNANTSGGAGVSAAGALAGRASAWATPAAAASA